MRGGQWQVLHLLRAATHEAVLAARPDSPLWEHARKAGVTVTPLSRAMFREARDVSLIHAHDARAHALAAIQRTPLVVSRRVAFPVKRGLFSRMKYTRASRYIAVSEFVKGRLLDAKIDESRIAVVYDGVPAMPLSSRLGQIIAPATADPRKSSAIVREAASLGGFDVRFSADLISDLGSARLFIYLSEEEGLGSAALLAMAAGVPVIASRVGGLPEAVDHGVTGVLVENRPAEVAAAVHCLLDDESTAGQMGEAARRRWESEFTVERMAQRTEAVYKECLR